MKLIRIMLHYQLGYTLEEDSPYALRRQRVKRGTMMMIFMTFADTESG